MASFRNLLKNGGRSAVFRFLAKISLRKNVFYTRYGLKIDGNQATTGNG